MGWKSGIAVAGALTLGLAACGDSDDDTTTAAEPEVTEAMGAEAACEGR